MEDKYFYKFLCVPVQVLMRCECGVHEMTKKILIWNYEIVLPNNRLGEGKRNRG